MFSLHHFHIINLLPHVYHFCLISGAHRARGLLLSLETKVTKNSLFHTAREVDEIEVSTKLDYRLHRAYNNSPALPPH